jgi:acyl-CoA thioesterase
MADFVRDTEVEASGEAGAFRASLSPEWAVWGPNGGYVAAIALRAAMAASRLPRPASFHCHFLAVGDFAPVTVRVHPLGGGKRAESLRADVVQGDRALLTATVWMVDEGLSGFEHDFASPPALPAPAALRGYQDLEENYAEWYPIWRSIEGRPTRWSRGLPKNHRAEPLWQTWMRFTDTAFTDRGQDALRHLLWLDFPGWNATTAAHAWPFPFLAPNLDLTVQFHCFAPESEWILADGFVPIARDGVFGCTSRLWTEDGRLLATGTSKHVCRANPNYAAEVERARSLGLLPPETR